MILAIPAGTTPNSDKMAMLLNEIQAMTATTWERQQGHWIGVHRDRWRQLLGGRYADVIRSARSLGFVEVNDRYSTGRFSKSIRLAKKF